MSHILHGNIQKLSKKERRGIKIKLVKLKYVKVLMIFNKSYYLLSGNLLNIIGFKEKKLNDQN